ncbi:DUF4440 domain-containing protein [Kocuria polaris]|nr:DUF4440 domain-containing protein [Kocuria polaris]
MSNIETIESHYRAGARGDLDAMLAPLAKDVRWTEAEGFPYAGTYIGPDDIVTNVFSRLESEWDEFRVTIDDLIDGGDVIVGVGTYSGTYRRTGQSTQARVAHIWRFSGDQVSSFEQITDTERIRRAMRDADSATNC